MSGNKSPTVKIVVLADKDFVGGEYSIKRMLDVVRNWNAGFRFDVEEHVFEPGRIDRSIIDSADELWFFGSEDRGPDQGASPVPEEFAWIGAKMDDGTGVFATGDHENTGGHLCGPLPRVAQMRIWRGAGVPGGDGASNRYDSTVRSPARDAVHPVAGSIRADDETDESDGIGKVVWPLHVGAEGAHALMRISFEDYVERAIRFLPDHSHEGRLIDVRGLSPTEQEALKPVFGDSLPQIVAWSTRRNLDGGERGAPYVYPVVSVFEPNGSSDAKIAQMGRIVVDSTFHHWTDINLFRYRFMPAWLHLEQYALNIANWLMRPEKLPQLRPSVVEFVRRNVELSDESLQLLRGRISAKTIAPLRRDVSRIVAKLRIPPDTLERILVGHVASRSRKSFEALVADNQSLDPPNWPWLAREEAAQIFEAGVAQGAVLGSEFGRIKTSNF